MSLEARFRQQVKVWRAHCDKVKFSSNPSDYLNCGAYRNLVELGEEALPLINKELNKPFDDINPLFGWSVLVREIVGERFEIPTSLQGKINAINQYTKNWLYAELKN